MTIRNLKTLKRQSGVATLAVVVGIMVVMGLIALGVSRNSQMEQKITGNDIRAREVQEAAEAGLEYALAWAKTHEVDSSLTCNSGSLPTGCPSALSTVTGSTTGESYNYELVFLAGADFIKVTSTATGAADSSIRATSETWVKQLYKGFPPGAVIPPPWVVAGCITNAPTGTPDSYILSPSGNAVISGTAADASCLPQGHLDVAVWADANGNGVQEAGEIGASAPFNTGTFSGCPSTNCAWKNSFGDLSLADAKAMATAASHVYPTTIPCGRPTTAPSIYLVNNGGPINSGDIVGTCSETGVDNTTIGAPHKPVIIIIPSSAGCPAFNGGITIYGIVYYETTTQCAANGWGGATIYGSVIWEGDVDKPNANSKFIEVDYQNEGDLGDVFDLGLDDAIRVPGTWKDF